MHIFTYGSLMYPPVWSRVVAGTYQHRGGTIRGYTRRRLSGEVYPALIPETEESAVEGVLYLDVSAPDVAALDHFEGEEYRRTPVAIGVDGGEIIDAWTYLYLYPERTEAVAWEPEQFATDGLSRFLATYCRDRGV
jgi:gamma-glutamylcyclotransferase (GGCT)/AIG2-like uncharacterized protein YtfP